MPLSFALTPAFPGRQTLAGHRGAAWPGATAPAPGTGALARTERLPWKVAPSEQVGRGRRCPAGALAEVGTSTRAPTCTRWGQGEKVDVEVGQPLPSLTAGLHSEPRSPHL